MNYQTQIHSFKTSDNERLHGALLTPPNKKSDTALIFVHGMAMNAKFTKQGRDLSRPRTEETKTEDYSTAKLVMSEREGTCLAQSTQRHLEGESDVGAYGIRPVVAE